MQKTFNMIIIINLFFILCFSSLSFPQEQITITTYYPSPYGSYRELRANRMAVSPTRAMPTGDGQLAWGRSRGLLSQDEGASIELGGVDEGPEGSDTPYIDFFNDTTSDFDMRIILMDDNTFRITGGETEFRDDSGSLGRIRLREIYFCFQ